MKYGSACDAGLLSERRTVATAPTLPPPSDLHNQRVMCECMGCAISAWFAQERESRERVQK